MSKIEIDYKKLELLINSGLSNKQISDEFDVSIATIKRKKKEFNLSSKFSEFKKENIKCLHCHSEFISLKKENRKFCSSSCSTTYNNLKRLKGTKVIINKRIRTEKFVGICLNCSSEINRSDEKGPRKYCSSQCQQDLKKKITFSEIENGNISLYFKSYKKYLIYKHGNKCMECSWSEVNIISGKVPIELEHIDGNSENNSLENLKLLCPNCHSLTPTYKALNSGNGRHKRMERYKEGKSY